MKRHNPYLGLAALLLCVSPARAGFLPEELRSELVKAALSGFWGTAKVDADHTAQPLSDVDRRTIPISADAVAKTIDVAELSGQAAWCGLDWKPHYLKLTQAARRDHLSGKQIAFIGVLHGVSMQLILDQMSQTACPGDTRNAVRDLLAQTLQIRFPNASAGATLEALPR